MFKKILSTLFILFSFISCKYDLLPAPSSNGNSNAPQFNNKKILPPQNVIASQGDYRSITLSWDPVKNATQYLIFSADTEFDTFEKVGETKGSATTFTVQEPTGSTKAYYIKSVDYYGNSSRPSFIAIGSTISVPIITDITKNKEGDIYTLNWWMSNCSESTYENLISYTINVYEEGINTPTKIEIPGNLTSYNLTSLKQSTVYKFTIEAFKTGTKQKHEISDAEPIETGHRIVPDAVKELTVSKGISTTDINISFKLPSTIESSTGDGTYEKDNPLYFTLKRKLADEDDSAFTTIYEYIGFNENSKYATNISADKKIILSGSYTEDQLVELTNELESADRGKKFVYQIQSYTDVNGNIENANISSAITSVASETGWTIAQASFKIEADNRIEDEKITNIDVTFHTNFNTLGIPYSFYLTQIRYDINNPNQVIDAEKIIKKSNNISELDNFSIYFNNPAAEKGYYEYKLYVAEKNTSSEIPANFYESINASSKITVTDDASKLPEIKYNEENTFHVDDGYADKFLLSWNNIADCSYILSWENYNGDGYSVTKSIGPFTTTNYSEPNDTGTVISNIKIENDKVVLTHSATSGEIRSYTLTAIKGLSNSCKNSNDFYTLGTAAPEMQTPDYDTITIVWDKVQKAKDDLRTAYSVSAKYTGETADLISSSNCEITEIENNKIQCIINKPKGYDDAKFSGKMINFSVKVNGEHDSTTATEEVYTLGPANLNVTRDPDLYADHINISWNRIEGANGYLVFRTIKDISGNYISEGNALFVNQDGVYYDGSKISSAESQFTGEKVSFTDCYEYTNRDDAQTDALKRDQIQLTWGLPFSYTVVPVLSDKDISFEISDSQIKAETTKKDHTFTYENMSETISSTIGYGLNVNASKAASNTTVTVTWDQPYNPANKNPKVYRRRNKGDKLEPVKIPLPPSDEKTMSVDIPYGPNDTDTYEYAVVYGSEFDETYLEKLASDFDTENSPKELKCKGYTLSLPQGNISAGSAGGYKEMFDWTGSTYDFDKRKLGPDYYEIQILNKNKASGWTAIAKIPVNLETKDYGKKASEDMNATTGVKLSSSNNYQAIFEPIFDTNNVAGGQMQVLRDYKHYYRLVAVKMTDDKRENAIEAVADIHYATDGSKYLPYGYRQITGEEFIKIGLLNYSYGIYQICNGKKWDSATYTDSDTNPWKASKSWGTITYSFNNYIANYETPYNETLEGFMKLSSTSSKINAEGTFVVIGYTENSYTKNIESITLNIIPNRIPNEIKDSYTGTITFETSYNNGSSTETGSSYLTVSTSKTLNNKSSITCNTAKNRRYWLPLMMNDDSEWYMWFNDTSDTIYYWWDTSSQGGN